MSATMNLSPKNLLILGAVAIGAYWFVARKSKSAGGSAGVPWYSNNQGLANKSTSGASRITDAGINLLGGLLGVGQPTYRAPGYSPGYFPDTAGETAAKRYATAVPDLFAANPPQGAISDFQGYVSTGGYLDSI